MYCCRYAAEAHSIVSVDVVVAVVVPLVAVDDDDAVQQLLVVGVAGVDAFSSPPPFDTVALVVDVACVADAATTGTSSVVPIDYQPWFYPDPHGR